MKAARTTLGLLLLASLLAVATPTATVAAECWTFHKYEKALATATNETRKDHDLNWLPIDPELSMAARVHSREMARKAELWHSDTNDIARLVDNTWVWMGENVGAGSDVDDMHAMFLRSSAHRPNIMNERWDWIGVGTVKGQDGRTYMTVLFHDGGPNLGTTMNKRYCR